MVGLRLLIEPHEGSAFERRLEGDQFIVGRAPTADILLQEAPVSRQHARFFRSANEWWVEDLGARNRTRLNEQEFQGPAPLREGDVVRVGHTRLHVLREGGRAGGDVSASWPVSEPVFLKTVAGIPDAMVTGVDGADHAARLAVLVDVHRALATAISLPKLLELVLERCFAVLRPEQGIILLKGADGELRRAAARSLTDAAEDIVVSRRIVEEVAGKGQSALVLNAAEDERFAGSESIMRSGVRSVAAVPLMDAAGSMGMIALYSRERVRRFTEPDLELLMSLASVATLRIRNVALTEEAAARLVLEQELSLAHEIQMGMLPGTLPTRPEVDVAATLTPARSVGGDLYDVVLVGSQLWFIIGDVSGKGMPAALYMAVAKTLFRAIAGQTGSVGDVLERMNQELCRDNEQLMFVTALLGCLDVTSGALALGDAGHLPVLLIGTDGMVSAISLPKGPALGVVPSATHQPLHLRLTAGETLVLYTDGVTDARNVLGESFGADRIKSALEHRQASSASAVVEELVAQLQRFTPGAPQDDDVAVLVLRFRGSGTPMVTPSSSEV